MAREPAVAQWGAEVGLDQFTDERHVPHVALIDVKNARFRKKGRIGKRYGHSLLAQPPGSEAGAGRLYAVGKQLVLGDGANLYSYTPNSTGTSTSQRFPTVGSLPKAYYDKIGAGSVVSYTAGIPWLSVPTDVAYGGSKYCVAWVSSTGAMYFEIYDETTGAPFGYAATSLAASVSFARVAYISGSFYVAVSYTGSTNIDVVIVPATGGPATTSTVNLTTAHKAASSFGFMSTAANQLVLVYQTGANYTPTTAVYSSAGALAAGPTAITEAFAAKKADMFIHGSSADNVYVIYAVTNAGTNYVRFGVSNATTAALVLAATTVASSGTIAYAKPVIYRYAATTAVAAYAAEDTTGPWTSFATLTSAGVVSTLTGATTYWSWPASGFQSTASGSYELWLTMGGAVQTSVYASGTKRAAVPLLAPTQQFTRALVSLSTSSMGAVSSMPHAVADVRSAATATGPVPSLAYVSALKFATAQCSNRDNYSLKDIAIHTAEFSGATRWQGAASGKHLVLSGGASTIYDGAKLRTAGNLYECQGPWTRTFAATASAMPAQTFAWCFLYRITDRTGQVIRGAPSAPMDALPAAGDTVTFTIPTLSLTAVSCEIEIYRTEQNGTTFYLHSTIANVPTSPTVSFSDDYSITDAVLATRPTLYTTGLSVENVMPPASVAAFFHKDRAFLCERDRVWFSKLYLDGEFPGFADQFTIDIPGGNIIAAASLDDFALLFERTKIWRLTGEGPNDQGNGNDYQVTRVPTELGCIDPGSVVTWSGGCFFRSSGGLYNINRGLGIEYLGRFVEDELTSATTITSAFVHPTERTVIFNLSGGTAGRRLVFDYTTQQWLRDILSEGIGSIYGAAVIDNSVYLAETYGGVYTETTSSFLDVSSWVTMSLKWGAVKLTGGVLGYQKVLGFEVQAERKTAHGFTASIYNDFSATPEAAQTWTEAQVSAFVGLPLYSVDVANTHPTGSGCSLQISDTAPATLGTGEGVAIIGVAVTGIAEPGTGRNPGANKR